MAAPSITAFPEKIINTFLSKWNAASLPIQYTITNDKFPVGEVVTNYFTQVLIFINGSLVATIKQIPDSNNETKVDVRKYAQTALKLLRTGTTRDTNASCEIFITGSEEYIDAASLPQSNAITGGGAGVIHFGTLSALPFGGTRGGNMYDYIMDRNKADLGKFMTFFERGQLVDSIDYLISFILNEPGYDFEVKQYDINAVLLATQLVSIPDEGVGVYRISLDDVDVNGSVSYFTIEILTDTYGTAVSEIFNVDADFDCIDVPLAPSNLTATTNALTPKTAIDLAWTDNSSDETGFIIRRGTISGSLTQIATVGANSTTFADTGLDDGTEYFYDVRATGDINSPASNEASAITAYDFENMGAFDGSNDQATLLALSEVIPDDFTFSIWIRRQVLQTVNTDPRMFSLNATGNIFFGCIFNALADMAKMKTFTTGYGTITGDTTPPDRDIPNDFELHNLVWVVDGTTKHVVGYTDGIKRVDFTYDGAGLGSPVTDIATSFAPVHQWGVAEIRVADVLMTQADIDEEWNNGNGGGWIKRNVTAANHTFLFLFNSASGLLAVDDSPGGNDMNLANIADNGFGVELTVSAESGSPTVGDLVTGGTSGATGLVVSHVATDLELEQIKGIFEAAEAVTSTGYSATVDSVLVRFWDLT